MTKMRFATAALVTCFVNFVVLVTTDALLCMLPMVSCTFSNEVPTMKSVGIISAGLLVVSLGVGVALAGIARNDGWRRISGNPIAQILMGATIGVVPLLALAMSSIVVDLYTVWIAFIAGGVASSVVAHNTVMGLTTKSMT